MSYVWHNIWSLAFVVGVIGNLTAAVIWAVPALRRLHKKLDRNHAATLAAHEATMKLHRHFLGKEDGNTSGR